MLLHTFKKECRYLVIQIKIWLFYQKPHAGINVRKLHEKQIFQSSTELRRKLT